MSNISSLSSSQTLAYMRTLPSTANGTNTSTQTDGTTSSTSSQRPMGPPPSLSGGSQVTAGLSTSSLDDSTLQALLTDTESTDTTSFFSEVASSLDADSDGSITEEEFTASLPDDISAEEADALWSSIDTEGTGSVTTEAFADSMEANAPAGPPPGGPPPMETASTEDSTSTEDLVSAMDADSSGTVSKSEFLAARPDDVSEDMASQLWDSFDTEGTGSLSTSDLQTAMASSAPQAQTATSLSSGQAFMQAARSYETMANYASSAANSSLSTLMAA